MFLSPNRLRIPSSASSARSGRSTSTAGRTVTAYLTPNIRKANCSNSTRAPTVLHQRHLENLAAQIDRAQPDYTIAEGSLAALELCEAAYVSIRNGSVPVPLPLDDFTPPPAVDWQPGLPYSGQGGGRNGRRLPPRPQSDDPTLRTAQKEDK